MRKILLKDLIFNKRLLTAIMILALPIKKILSPISKEPSNPIRKLLRSELWKNSRSIMP